MSELKTRKFKSEPNTPHYRDVVRQLERADHEAKMTCASLMHARDLIFDLVDEMERWPHARSAIEYMQAIQTELGYLPLILANAIAEIDNDSHIG